jgi:hypothetical protein
MRPWLIAAGICVALSALTVVLLLRPPYRVLWSYEAPSKIQSLSIGPCGEIGITTGSHIYMLDSHCRPLWQQPNPLHGSEHLMRWSYFDGGLAGYNLDAKLVWAGPDGRRWSKPHGMTTHMTHFLHPSKNASSDLLWIQGTVKEGGQLLGFDSQGNVRRRILLEKCPGLTHAAFGPAGTLYCVNDPSSAVKDNEASVEPSTPNILQAYTEDLKLLWQTQLTKSLDKAGPLTLSNGNLAVRDGGQWLLLTALGQSIPWPNSLEVDHLAVNESGRIFYASHKRIGEIDANGSVLHSNRLRDGCSGLRVCGSDYLLVRTQQRLTHGRGYRTWLNCFTVDLHLRWSLPLEDEAQTTVRPDGTLVVTDGATKLEVLKP